MVDIETVCQECGGYGEVVFGFHSPSAYDGYGERSQICEDCDGTGVNFTQEEFELYLKYRELFE